MKCENKNKNKGKRIDIWREQPCKKNDKKRQKSEVEPSSNRREREKSLETFEKMILKKSRSYFKKAYS